jgi:hypothetical protein
MQTEVALRSVRVDSPSKQGRGLITTDSGVGITVRRPSSSGIGALVDIKRAAPQVEVGPLESRRGPRPSDLCRPRAIRRYYRHASSSFRESTQYVKGQKPLLY